MELRLKRRKQFACDDSPRFSLCFMLVPVQLRGYETGPLRFFFFSPYSAGVCVSAHVLGNPGSGLHNSAEHNQHLQLWFHFVVLLLLVAWPGSLSPATDSIVQIVEDFPGIQLFYSPGQSLFTGTAVPQEPMSGSMQHHYIAVTAFS